MSDVVGNEPHGVPRWVVAVGVAAVAAVAAVLVLRSGGAAPRPTAGATPSSAPSIAVRLAGSACGGDIEQPVVDALSKPEGTGLRMLVGDRDLRLVDVDQGWAKVLAPPSRPRAITQLVRNGRDVVALLSDRCTAGGFGGGQVGIVDADTGVLSPKGRGDDILPGLPTTVVQFDADGAVRLRELAGSRLTKLPPGWRPWARTPAGFFADVQNNGFDAGVPPTVGVGTTASARLSRSFGDGNVVGASGRRVFWMASCNPGPCLLTWRGEGDGASTAQRVGTAAWGGVVSPDSNRLAFRLPRTTGRFGSHPGAPNDVAVLDIRTGRVQVLPGLVLPPKAGLTLAWSADSTWLAVGADLGTGALLLLWRDGMKKLARVPLPETGGGTTGPPALAFVDQSR